MNNFVKIDSSADLMRDMSSGAVINTNNAAYAAYMRKKAAEDEIKEQVKTNAGKIEQIETDISEIKQLLISLINKDK
jgi:glutaredoxin 2